LKALDYIIATTTAEAVEALKKARGKGRIIAGGTDAVLDLEDGKYSAELLVDVTRIPELLEIRQENGALVIGAAVSIAAISRHPLVKKFAPSLAKAASRIGSPQIANVATLAGNVITAQPAADGAMALATLEPEFTIVGPGGASTASMGDMYVGFGKSAIDSTKEVLTHIKIPCQKAGEASEFVRLDMRESLALPMLNVSAKASIKNGKFDWVRIAMGPVGVGPVRAQKAEAWLAQKDATPDNIRQASRLALEDANPRSSPFRGSKEYRLTTLPTMVEAALLGIATQTGWGVS